MIDNTKVIVPQADQGLTTGALRRGPVITNVPTTFAEALAAIAGFTSSGYLSEDGATLATERGIINVREWNGGTVRRSAESFDGTLSTTLIQLDEESAKQAFGPESVDIVEATTSHGTQMHIALGAELSEPQAWALCMKDGDARIIVLVCSGNVTSGVDITFAASEAIQLPVEISGNVDATGKTIHIFTDDGKALPTSASTDLSALTIGSLTLTPAFAAATTEYTATTTESTDAVTATAASDSAAVVITVNGSSITSGDDATWATGTNEVKAVVTNGGHSKTYTVTVTKSSE